MYYVLQVAPGTEIKTETYISNLVSRNLYGQCFHPTRHMRKKFHGSWKDIHEKLLPGYVFITTDNIRMLYMELQKIPVFTKLLGKEHEYFARLEEQDAEWLEKLMGNSSGGKDAAWQEVSISKVRIDEGNEIRIISGPLKHMGGMIKKINLHKRMAEVEIEFMNRRTVIYLGIELLEKKEMGLNPF